MEELFGLGPDFFRDARRQLLERRRFRFETHHDAPGNRRMFLGIAVSNLGARDVVRHKIVQDIVEAYRVFGEQRARTDG